jgi:hypothetical protein
VPAGIVAWHRRRMTAAAVGPIGGASHAPCDVGAVHPAAPRSRPWCPTGHRLVARRGSRLRPRGAVAGSRAGRASRAGTSPLRRDAPRCRVGPRGQRMITAAVGPIGGASRPLARRAGVAWPGPAPDPRGCARAASSVLHVAPRRAPRCRDAARTRVAARTASRVATARPGADRTGIRARPCRLSSASPVLRRGPHRCAIGSAPGAAGRASPSIRGRIAVGCAAAPSGRRRVGRPARPATAMPATPGSTVGCRRARPVDGGSRPAPRRWAAPVRPRPAVGAAAAAAGPRAGAGARAVLRPVRVQRAGRSRSSPAGAGRIGCRDGDGRPDSVRPTRSRPS